MAKNIKLATWGTRFLAWLVDVIILGIIIGFIPVNTWLFINWGWFGLSFQVVILLLYWTITEGYKGQSLGKMIFNIKVTDMKGNKIGYDKALIQAIGKSLILPLDFLIGLFISENRQRLFNKLSDTIVIKEPSKKMKGVKYEK